MAVVIKAYLLETRRDAEIRRFLVDNVSHMKYSFLRDKVIQMFPSLRGEDFQLLWKDEEGDLVTCSSDEELSVALSCCREPVFRLIIRRNSQHRAPRGFGPHAAFPWAATCEKKQQMFSRWLREMLGKKGTRKEATAEKKSPEACEIPSDSSDADQLKCVGEMLGEILAPLGMVAQLHMKQGEQGAEAGGSENEEGYKKAERAPSSPTSAESSGAGHEWTMVEPLEDQALEPVRPSSPASGQSLDPPELNQSELPAVQRRQQEYGAWPSREQEPEVAELQLLHQQPGAGESHEQLGQSGSTGVDLAVRTDSAAPETVPPPSTPSATAGYPSLDLLSRPSLDVRSTDTLRQMKAMGFTDGGGWLSSLIAAKSGDIGQVLDVLSPVQRSQPQQQRRRGGQMV